MSGVVAKYQKYAEYKDSGVEWLGEIPIDWGIGALRFCFADIKNGSTANQLEESNETVPISRIESISTGEINYEKVGFVSKNSISESYKTIEGDILLSHINSLSMVGNVALKRDSTLLYHGMNLLRLIPKKDKFNPKYLFWTLKSKYFRNAVESIAKPAINQASVSIDSLKNINLLIPLYTEQIQIANFLDHETAKIDSLIEKQQQLIELLKEKRQAVISHAVTKGLNPDAPMKDSGVEWLGQVPAHWQVIKFNHCVQIRNGLVDPRHENYKDLILYAPNHIEKGTGKILYKETAAEQGADSNKYLCFKGEIIYSKIRPALAKVAICEEDLALCSADMYPIDGFNGLINQFLYYFILSDSFTGAVILDSDRVAMPKINRESLNEYKLPIPPLEEQLRIVAFIEAISCKLDELEQQAQKAIQLMQERRTALISAAVTGKIDVRNWQNPTKNTKAKMECSA